MTDPIAPFVADETALDAAEPAATAGGDASAAGLIAPTPPQRSRLVLGIAGLVAMVVLVVIAAIVASGGGSRTAWGWSPAPKPSDWRYYGWGNPALEIALPADWNGYDMPVMSIDPSASPDVRKNQEHSNAWLRAGAWRVAIGSQVGTGSPATYDWAGVIVESGDASLSSQADRVISSSITAPVGRSDVHLPAGEAIALTFAGNDGGGSFVEVDHLLRLPDGRSLTIMVSRWVESGPPPDRRLVEAMARQIAETLRVTP